MREGGEWIFQCSCDRPEAKGSGTFSLSRFSLPSGQYSLYLYFSYGKLRVCPLTKVEKVGSDGAEIWTRICLTPDFVFTEINNAAIFLRPWITRLMFTICFFVGFVLFFFFHWRPKKKQQREDYLGRGDTRFFDRDGISWKHSKFLS